MAFQLAQLLVPGSKLYAKSEFGPAHSGWPALSFSSQKIASNFAMETTRGKDFVIYVGTSNPKDTPNPSHRQRIVSVIDVEPSAIVQTKQIVSPDAWANARAMYPGRWDVSLRIARAWDVENFPYARDVMPVTYRRFQSPATRGHPISVDTSDLMQLGQLNLIPVELSMTERANSILALDTNNKTLSKEISRLVNLISKDIEQSLTTYGAIHPLRISPNISDLFIGLSQMWAKQGGRCALCSQPVPINTKNKLLQLSRDRIDSGNKEYGISNIQLTHLGCNLAKSSASMAEWSEFLGVLNGKDQTAAD